MRLRSSASLVTLVLTLLASPAGVMADENCGPTLVDARVPSVHVFAVNDASVPADLLHRAEAEVSRIFEDIGVAVIWTPAWPCGGQRPLIVRITAREMPERIVSPSTLGFTPGERGRRGVLAYVFYTRVAQASQKYLASIDKILAVTIVHELGHMLLPYGSHATSGVMSAKWDESHFRLATCGDLLFMPEVAAQIRNGLPR
jgi:hypothetical protein